MSDAAPKHAGGRPSLYNPELADAICERLAHGEPLTIICNDEDMPSFSTVYRWEQDNEEFRQLSAHAREIGTHYLAYDCITIADGPGEAADKRIKIDTRLRLIGKWNAKRYGDRVSHVGGGPDDAPIRHEFGAVSDEELEARIAAKMAALAETPPDGAAG